MWAELRTGLDEEDSMIVDGDFVIAKGRTRSYSFLRPDENPLRRHLIVPVFHIFKVHEGAPLKLYSEGTGHISILPANWGSLFDDPRYKSPADVYADKNLYDLSTFVIVPYAINEKAATNWEKFDLGGSFQLGELKTPATLLYADNPLTFSSQDSLFDVGRIMPSFVLSSLFSWVSNPSRVYLDGGPIGRIEITIETARDLSAKCIHRLEKRYDTRLTFDAYRRDFPSLWGD